MHRWGQSQMFRSLAFYLSRKKALGRRVRKPSEINYFILPDVGGR